MRLLTLVLVGAVLTIPQALGERPLRPNKLEVGPWPFALAPGKWRVEFANGVVETCEVHRDGKATVVEPLRQSAGRLEAQGGSVVIAFADDRTERWTPVGTKYVVEHWFPASRLPVATPVLGIAETAQQ